MAKVSESLLSMFVHRTIVVEVEKDLEVRGKLLRFQMNQRNKPHRPNLLIVGNGSERTIIRGNWIALKIK